GRPRSASRASPTSRDTRTVDRRQARRASAESSWTARRERRVCSTARASSRASGSPARSSSSSTTRRGWCRRAARSPPIIPVTSWGRPSMATDKVLLEVLNTRFTGIVDEMGYIIHRASFTVFIKETWDFDSALVSADGEIFCYPRNIGVTNMLGMHMGDAIRAIAHVEPVDLVVTNDPQRTRGVCTHLPETLMF